MTLRAQPVLDAAQRVVLVRRVEQHQGQVGIIQVQRVDQPVVGLPGEIPQNGLTPRPVRSGTTELVEQPELLAVRRGVLHELTMRQPPPQSGLAHARLTDKHDLRCRIADAGRRGMHEQTIDIKLPQVHSGTVTALACRSDRRQDRLMWVECGAFYQVGESGSEHRQSCHAASSFGLPETHGAVSAIRRQHPTIAGKRQGQRRVGVALKDRHGVASGHVPQSDGAIEARTGQNPAFRMEGGRGDPIRVSVESAEALSARDPMPRS